VRQLHPNDEITCKIWDCNGKEIGRETTIGKFLKLVCNKDAGRS